MRVKMRYLARGETRHCRSNRRISGMELELKAIRTSSSRRPLFTAVSYLPTMYVVCQMDKLPSSITCLVLVNNLN